MESAMNRSAKRYIDWAYEYQVAALTLYTQIATAPYLYNPTIFLLRHTIELQLKGLIIGEVKRTSNTRIVYSSNNVIKSFVISTTWAV